MIKHFKDLMTSVDLLNTLHGGISEPFLSFREDPAGREMRVRVPGLPKEALRVSINDNELSVYYMIPMESSGKQMHMPQLAHSQKIPYFIEASGIKAMYDDDELVVKLPFSEPTNGYNRKIHIEGE
jgi:HSP20 family molecular chaperone IbpA